MAMENYQQKNSKKLKRKQKKLAEREVNQLLPFSLSSMHNWKKELWVH